FTPSMVYIRVSTEKTDTGSEGAINVHLDFPMAYCADPNYEESFFIWLFELLFGIESPLPLPNFLFRVTNKNCDLVLTSNFFDYAQENPYNTTGVDATLRTGSGTLSASFQSNIVVGGGSSTDNEQILNTVHNYSILPCSNPVVPSPQFLDTSEP